MNPKPDADQRIVARRYAVLETLHLGAGSEVVSAVDRWEPQQDLVLKLVSSDSQRMESRVSRLESEYRYLRALDHPGLPTALDFGRDGALGKTFLVLDRAPGVTVDRLAPIDAVLAAGLTGDLCRILSALHARSLLHLDVKPLNVLHDRARSRTTLVDLDLAAFPENALGRGTFPYAAPEIMVPGASPDARSDLFSLGVTLYELVSGVPLRPMPIERPLELPESAPGWLRTLVQRLTQIRPENRIASAREVLRLLPPSGGAVETRVTRSALLRRPPFVGRQDALASILEAIPTDGRSGPPVVVVRSAPGAGASRIAYELETEWKASGVSVVPLVPLGTGGPTLGPVLRLLDLLRVLQGEPLSEEKQAGGGPIDLDALATQLLGLARRRRTVILAQDVDDLDRGTRDVLLQLLRRVTHEFWESGRAPVEIFVTFRRDARIDDGLRTYLESEPDTSGVRVVELEPLAPETTAELVRGLFSPESVPKGLGERLHHCSGGSPLFLVEMALANPQFADGSGTLLGRLEEEQVLADDAVPDSIEAAIQRRLTAVDGRARQALAIVALFPAAAPVGLVEDMLGEGVPSAHGVLESLVRDGFLERREGRVGFVSALCRLVTRRDPGILASLPALHDDLAARLLGSSAPDWQVAAHRLQGRGSRSGLGLAYDAAYDLRTKGGGEELVRLLEHVVGATAVSTFAWRWASIMLTDLHLERGHPRGARRCLDQLLERARPGDLAVERRQARLVQREGSPNQALQIVERLLRLQDRLSAEDGIELVTDAAEMSLAVGRTSDAREFLRRVHGLVSRYVPAPPPSVGVEGLERVRAPRMPWPGDLAAPMARYLGVLGEAARLEGELELALTCQLSTVKLRSRLGDLTGLGRSLHGIGTIFLGAGLHEAAERYFRRALSLRRDAMDVAGQADSANNLGVLCRKVGRTSEAIDHYRTSLRLRRQIGHAAGEAFSYINIANVHYERRELDAAVKYYERALDLARRLSDARSQAQVMNNLGAVAHLRDRYEESIRFYEEAERLDRMAGNLNGALSRRLNLAEEWLRVGFPDRAARLLETVRRTARRRQDPAIEARLHLLEARVAMAEGLLPRAEERLRAAGGANPQGDDSVRGEIVLEQARLDVLCARPKDALRGLHELERQDAVPEEVRAAVAVVKARALAGSGPAERAAAEAELADGERVARRGRMPGLEFQCAWGRAVLRAVADDEAQALAAYSTALEALEVVLEGLRSESLLKAYLNRPEIRTFARDVESFGRRFSAWSRGKDHGHETVRRVREVLFQAGRHIGLRGGSQRQEEMSRRILEVSRTLRSTAPLDELFREIVDGAVDFSGAERAFLITVDSRGRIRIPVARTREREAVPEPEAQVSRRILAEVIEQRRSMRLTDATGSHGTAESVVNLDLRSIVCAPMLRGSQVIGLLYVDNRSRAGQFTGADQELIDIFATQAAIALENARLSREFARNEKSRVMGTLASGVAHDFNNLLAVILGRAQQLADEHRDPNLLQGLATIEKAARDGAAVVSRMQEFTRTRRERLPFRAVQVRRVVEDVFQFTRARSRAQPMSDGGGVETVCEVPPDLHVVGNVTELREVFTNLVLNAIAAMPDGGRLVIRGNRGDGGRAEMVVEDSGHGMSEEVRDSIFDAYFTTRGEGGSGLGMTIVDSILERHEGSIRVESELGAGTRVYVTLPLADLRDEAPDDLPSSLSGPPPTPSENLVGRRLLVVDDESSIRELLGDVLRKAGHEVELLSSGAQALERLDGDPVDAVVTDLAMVPVSGWEVAQAVKRQWPGVPVVLITGWGAELTLGTARRRGVDLLVAKPFNIHAVVGDIQALLKRPLPTSAEDSRSEDGGF